MNLAAFFNGRPALAIMAIVVSVLAIVAFSGTIRDAGRRQ